jgi:hypothetical protein
VGLKQASEVKGEGKVTGKEVSVNQSNTELRFQWPTKFTPTFWKNQAPLDGVIKSFRNILPYSGELSTQNTDS